ncbi:MAG TPA: pilus assembly protein, partial [Aquifex aeolicus]|nr:pilus assembly protein [Aquifex aeolicus]
MKGFVLVLVGLFLSIGLSLSQVIKEMRFEGVPLETVIKALSKAIGKNVIIDPTAKDALQGTADIYIQKPLRVEKAFNLILREYGLVAIPVNEDIYRITKAGEVEISVRDLTEKDVEKVIDLLKDRVSPAAEIVIDKTLKTIYIRDEERRVKRLEERIKAYIERLKAERELRVEEEEEEIVTTRVFYLKTINVREA